MGYQVEPTPEEDWRVQQLKHDHNNNQNNVSHYTDSGEINYLFLNENEKAH